MPRVLGKPRKRSNILALELTVTGLEFGRRTKRSNRYNPFLQITDEGGHVVGRSVVLFDCCVSARWPPIRINWDKMVQRQVKKDCASDEPSRSFLKKRRPFRSSKKKAFLGESEQASSEEAARSQPLLITIYDFREDGRHVIVGHVNTTVRELKVKAHHFDAPNHSLGKLSHEEASFQFLADSPKTKLYVKRIQSTQGKPNALLQNQFFESKIKHVPAPSGLPAEAAPNKNCDNNPQFNWDIRNGESLSSFDETLPTDCSSRPDDATETSWLSSPRLLERSVSLQRQPLQKEHSIRSIALPMDTEGRFPSHLNESNRTSPPSPRGERPRSVKTPLLPPFRSPPDMSNTTALQETKNAALMKESIRLPSPCFERPGSVKLQTTRSSAGKAVDVPTTGKKTIMRWNDTSTQECLMDEMKAKLRRLAELRILSEFGALPPAQAQEFQVLTRLLERFETQAQQRPQHAAQRQQQEVQKLVKVSLSPAAEMQMEMKRMEKVLEKLYSTCVAQGKGGQFKAYLKIMERLEVEARQQSPSKLNREKATIEQAAVLSWSAIQGVKTKLAHLEQLQAEPVIDSSVNGDDDVSTVAAPALSQQVTELRRLLGRLENHQQGLHTEWRRHEESRLPDQSNRKGRLEEALTEAMKAKLRSMEAVIDTICKTESPHEEAKYITMFIKLLDSWEEEEETEEERVVKQEQTKALQGESLNLSLIDGLNTKLKQIEHLLAPCDSEQNSEEEEEEATKREETESQADLLARVLQRLEGHEARRRADVQRLEQVKLERTHPAMKQASDAASTIACF